MNGVSAWWQQVSATVANGLQITIVGMALVFLTLGLIIVALTLLRRLPGPKKPTKEPDVANTSATESAVTAKATGADETKAERAQDVELAQIAAIAVALLRSTRSTAPRSTAPRSRPSRTGRWKQYGRAHQLGL